MEKVSKKEIMEIIESLNNSPEVAYIEEMKKEKEEKNTGIKTRIIDLGNGSKRYVIELNETFKLTYTSPINFTHAVIGKDFESGEFRTYGFHSKLELAQKKMKKFTNKVSEIFIVELV